MSDIFISYARADLARAMMLVEALEDRGWSVYWDQAIVPGTVFDAVIESELLAAKCVIVLWSKTSVQSQWVRAEAGNGLNRRVLIPVIIEDVEVPLVFRQLQSAVMVDWEGSLSDPGFKQLEQAITDVVGPPLAPKGGGSGKMGSSVGLRFPQQDRGSVAESPLLTSPTSATSGNFKLEKVEQELALYIGPIARILVKKMASQATSLTNLYKCLANYIPREEERARFLDKALCEATDVVRVVPGSDRANKVLRLKYKNRKKEIAASVSEFSMGRGGNCDLLVDTLVASRWHARIEFRQGRFVLVDESTNGTYVKLAGGSEVCLRRHELPLSGEGAISLGQSVIPADEALISVIPADEELIYYSCP